MSEHFFFESLVPVRVNEPYKKAQQENTVGIQGVLFTRITYNWEDTIGAIYGARCKQCFGSNFTRIKLGGVCTDVDEPAIANLIFYLTGIAAAGVAMFTKNKGLCSVWLHCPTDAILIRSAVHHRVWMGPVSDGEGFALVTEEQSSPFVLENCLASIKRKGLKFPCHLVTVEPWEE